MEILVDDREDSSKIKMAKNHWREHEVEVQRLKSGDYVFPEINLAFETKWSYKDLRDSLYKDRLFRQIQSMSSNFEHSTLIVVGNYEDEVVYNPFLTFPASQIYGLRGSLMAGNYPYCFLETPQKAFKQMDAYIRECQKGGHKLKQAPMVCKHETPAEKILRSLGVGSRQRVDILSCYSIRELHDASIDDLMKIRGVGKRTAEKLKAGLY